MIKAIGSKVLLDSPNGVDFMDCIKDLLELEDVKNLDQYMQHLKTSRLQHSINVSYYTYWICKKLNWDYRSAARGGLLHDLYLYDWRTERQPEGNHIKAHPIVALRTAQKNVELNDIEIDSIINHMWPVTFGLPRYKESMLLTFVDKYVTILEVTYQALASIVRKE